MRDIGRIKVEIRLEVAALALLTFWNVPLLEILIRRSDAVYFWKLPDLMHEIPAKKHHFPSYIRILFYFYYFSLISQILTLLFRIFLGDFVGLGKGELTCKRGRRN